VPGVAAEVEGKMHYFICQLHGQYTPDTLKNGCPMCQSASTVSPTAADGRHNEIVALLNRIIKLLERLESK